MQKIEIKKDWIMRAKERAVLDASELTTVNGYVSQSGIHSFDLELKNLPDPIWRAMLDDAKLPAKIRSAIALHVFGMRQGDVRLESVYATSVESAVEFGTTLQLVVGRSPNAELRLNGRWYPVIITVQFLEDEQKWTRGIQVSSSLRLGDHTFLITHYVGRSLFLDESLEPRPQTVLVILEKFGYRALQTGATEFNLRLVKAERAAATPGELVMVTGSVIIPSRYLWWQEFETQALGTEDMPSRCVIEPALEVNADALRGYHGIRQTSEETQSRLPFVRLFCLETKSYVYADVDDVRPYEFDSAALSRLHLPQDMHSILSRVFRTPIDKMFGDLLKGKHGGVVVLASGEPGVGKTLTAEIYAETTQRPLYVLELGELGTKASEVEAGLQTVFARVMRWNAVLQFDECEIFLAKRGSDLERSAIVGIFLRLLDYYRGLLFLTTNRPEVLDEAVLSRVMLRLQYPHLDAVTRARIWESMFGVAKLRLEGLTYARLGTLDINGRQIRNLTRLAKILHPEGLLSVNAMQEVLRFGCGQSMSDGTPADG
jgi:hypothetical protein